ncbi:hypothetical protein AB0P21_03030 [Kribbella sp. NPDC056861]|uniref:hypothetical protein n=1 Tax=Kribbella sp. NPDC056861 TaxID=3154857 RepID=UPI00341A48ED
MLGDQRVEQRGPGEGDLVEDRGQVLRDRVLYDQVRWLVGADDLPVDELLQLVQRPDELVVGFGKVEDAGLHAVADDLLGGGAEAIPHGGPGRIGEIGGDGGWRRYFAGEELVESD